MQWHIEISPWFSALSLYLKLSDTHSHTLESMRNLIKLYEAWNKTEKAKEWRAKLPQTETVNEWHNALKMAQISSVGAYNRCTTIQPLISPFMKTTHLVSILFTGSYGGVKICRRLQWTSPNSEWHYLIHCDIDASKKNICEIGEYTIWLWVIYRWPIPK